MILDNLLKENGYDYTFQEYSENVYLYKLFGKINLVHMIKNDSAFLIDRDLHYYLNSQNIPYTFLFENKLDGKFFSLDFKENSNWLTTSFERSNKEKLYFGKIILNNQISLINFLNKLQKIV